MAVTYLFLTQSNADKVSAVSLSSSNYTVTDIFFADGPNRIAMSPDVRRAYVTNANEGTVFVIYTANLRELSPRITVAKSLAASILITATSVSLSKPTIVPRYFSPDCKPTVIRVASSTT